MNSINEPIIGMSKYTDEFLDQSLQKRISETHCQTKEEYVNFLKNNHQEALKLEETLQNSYSEFFRASFTFSVLEHLVLPTLLLHQKNNRTKEVRVWSCACAAGQEAYSLAILLEEFKKRHLQEFTYRIFATDQKESQISKAQKGIYPAKALNNLSLIRSKEWFTQFDDTYLVKQNLKERIDFSVFDLFTTKFSSPPASIYGEFDVVICANLLFYYKPEYQKIILDKVGKSLNHRGYLMTGETERDIVLNNNYQELYPESAIFRKKEMP